MAPAMSGIGERFGFGVMAEVDIPWVVTAGDGGPVAVSARSGMFRDLRDATGCALSHVDGGSVGPVCALRRARHHDRRAWRRRCPWPTIDASATRRARAR